MPEVHGYKIREAIKNWELRKKTFRREFTDSLFSFKEEQKQNAEEVFRKLERADEALSHLRALQQRYNRRMKFRFQGEEITLALAISLLGKYESQKSLWEVAGSSDGGMYGFQGTVRDKDSEYATRSIPVSQCYENAEKVAKKISELGCSIATANAIPTTFEDLDHSLLE